MKSCISLGFLGNRYPTSVHRVHWPFCLHPTTCSQKQQVTTSRLHASKVGLRVCHRWTKQLIFAEIRPGNSTNKLHSMVWIFVERMVNTGMNVYPHVNTCLLNRGGPLYFNKQGLSIQHWYYPFPPSAFTSHPFSPTSWHVPSWGDQGRWLDQLWGSDHHGSAVSRMSQEFSTHALLTSSPRCIHFLTSPKLSDGFHRDHRVNTLIHWLKLEIWGLDTWRCRL